MRLKLAGRERRKLVCSPLDEPLASNRVSDCLHAQFSWLKKRDRYPPLEGVRDPWGKRTHRAMRGRAQQLGHRRAT